MNLPKQRQNGAGASPTQEEMPILIGLGANLPSGRGTPAQTLCAALDRLAEQGLTVLRRSRFWRSPPWPPSDQPWYVNAVASVSTTLPPDDLLAALHRVEAEFGRERSVPNAARPIDLDLLAYRGEIRRGPDLILPHPRLTERAFVLLPLAEIAAMWCHPVTDATIAALIAVLPADHMAEPIEEGNARR